MPGFALFMVYIFSQVEGLEFSGCDSDNHWCCGPSNVDFRRDLEFSDYKAQEEKSSK